MWESCSSASKAARGAMASLVPMRASSRQASAFSFCGAAEVRMAVSWATRAGGLARASAHEASRARVKPETRNPKPERRPKPEIRKAHVPTLFGLRISAFGLLSGPSWQYHHPAPSPRPSPPRRGRGRDALHAKPCRRLLPLPLPGGEGRGEGAGSAVGVAVEICPVLSDFGFRISDFIAVVTGG